MRAKMVHVPRALCGSSLRISRCEENCGQRVRLNPNIAFGTIDAGQCVASLSHIAAAAGREGYADVRAMVRKRPAESLLACFGVGLVTGVVVSLLLQRK